MGKAKRAHHPAEIVMGAGVPFAYPTMMAAGIFFARNRLSFWHQILDYVRTAA